MSVMTPGSIADYAWIATRSKALLTAADKARLSDMRGVYGLGRISADPHVSALIDALLAP